MSSPSAVRFTSFTIGPGLYAVESSTIHQALATRSDLRGEVPFQGELFTLLDPRLLFDLPTARRECRALLIGEADKAVALMVDELGREMEVDRRRIQELPWHFGGREQLWFGGVVPLPGDRAMALLRPAGLLASYRTLGPGASGGSADAGWEP